MGEFHHAARIVTPLQLKKFFTIEMKKNIDIS